MDERGSCLSVLAVGGDMCCVVLRRERQRACSLSLSEAILDGEHEKVAAQTLPKFGFEV